MTFRSLRAGSLAIVALGWLAPAASGATIAGAVQPTTPQARYLALRMTITETTTRFELTGPDFCYFSFGFDTDVMEGYSLIVTGSDAARTVVEQNLLGTGSPGDPQGMQDINVVSVTHDAANDLSTVIVERLNQTGDPDDPDFTTSMTALDVIWAYNSFASPAFPNPNLNYHGSLGRGGTQITFAPVPEPASASLAAVALLASMSILRARPSGA